MPKIEVSLRSIFFLIGLFKIDPPQADLKYSIFNRKYSIIRLSASSIKA